MRIKVEAGNSLSQLDQTANEVKKLGKEFTAAKKKLEELHALMNKPMHGDKGLFVSRKPLVKAAAEELQKLTAEYKSKLEDLARIENAIEDKKLAAKQAKSQRAKAQQEREAREQAQRAVANARVYQMADQWAHSQMDPRQRSLLAQRYEEESKLANRAYNDKKKADDKAVKEKEQNEKKAKETADKKAAAAVKRAQDEKKAAEEAVANARTFQMVDQWAHSKMDPRQRELLANKYTEEAKTAKKAYSDAEKERKQNAAKKAADDKKAADKEIAEHNRLSKETEKNRKQEIAAENSAAKEREALTRREEEQFDRLAAAMMGRAIVGRGGGRGGRGGGRGGGGGGGGSTLTYHSPLVRSATLIAEELNAQGVAPAIYTAASFARYGGMIGSGMLPLATVTAAAISMGAAYAHSVEKARELFAIQQRFTLELERSVVSIRAMGAQYNPTTSLGKFAYSATSEAQMSQAQLKAQSNKMKFEASFPGAMMSEANEQFWRILLSSAEDRKQYSQGGKAKLNSFVTTNQTRMLAAIEENMKHEKEMETFNRGIYEKEVTQQGSYNVTSSGLAIGSAKAQTMWEGPAKIRELTKTAQDEANEAMKQRHETEMRSVESAKLIADEKANNAKKHGLIKDTELSDILKENERQYDFNKKSLTQQQSLERSTQIQLQIEQRRQDNRQIEMTQMQQIADMESAQIGEKSWGLDRSLAQLERQYKLERELAQGDPAQQGRLDIKFEADKQRMIADSERGHKQQTEINDIMALRAMHSISVFEAERQKLQIQEPWLDPQVIDKLARSADNLAKSAEMFAIKQEVRGTELGMAFGRRDITAMEYERQRARLEHPDRNDADLVGLVNSRMQARSFELTQQYLRPIDQLRRSAKYLTELHDMNGITNYTYRRSMLDAIRQVTPINPGQFSTGYAKGFVNIAGVNIGGAQERIEFTLKEILKAIQEGGLW
jgi:hypothetical protein